MCGVKERVRAWAAIGRDNEVGTVAGSVSTNALYFL